MAERITVTTTATPEVVDRAHDELDSLWTRHRDVTEDDRRRFETGVMEVLGNIVEHAYRLTPVAPEQRLLTVEVEVTDDVLRALLSDNGRPVEVDLADVTMPPPETEHGRGLALARASLDTLHHERVNGCNWWLLLCSRGATP
jgi:serine/threonine-protein kinase RsbW